MTWKLTRRQWTSYIAALPLLAQQQPQTLPATVVEDTDQARARTKVMSAELATFSIPMKTEPAFQFKA